MQDLKVAQNFKKLTKWKLIQFLLNIDGFKLVQKVTNIWVQLFENSLARTLKNRPICSHCFQLSFLLQLVCQNEKKSPHIRVPSQANEVVVAWTESDGCFGSANAIKYLEHVQGPRQ